LNTIREMIYSNANHFPAGSLNSDSSNPNSPTFAFNRTGVPFALRPGTSLENLAANSPASPSTDSTLGRSYLDHVKSWDDDQISNWLTEVNVAQYIQLFRSNDIRGNVLLDVDQTALKEMGIRSVGDRIKVVVAIKALRQRCITSARMERQSTSSRELLANGSPSPAPSGSFIRSLSTSTQSPVPVATTLNGSSMRRNSSGRLPGRIPPPLHLSQSNATPSNTEAWQPLGTSTMASRPTHPTASTPPSIVSNNISRPNPRAIPPPSLPPPRSHPPRAPTSSNRAQG
jgi:mitogen-activated protein kinase kinase kinase